MAPSPALRSRRSPGNSPCTTSSASTRRSAGTAPIFGVDRGIDFGAPAGRGRARRHQIHRPAPGALAEVGQSAADEQIGLGVADKILHDALGLRVLPVAEVRPEPVVAGEADVVRGRDHPVGDQVGLEAGHPVGEDHLGPAESLEDSASIDNVVAPRLLVGEPPLRPGQDRADHVQPASTPLSITRWSPGDHTAGRRPLDDDCGPVVLDLGDEPTGVPRGPLVADGSHLGQQPLSGVRAVAVIALATRSAAPTCARAPRRRRGARSPDTSSSASSRTSRPRRATAYLPLGRE